MCSTCRGGGGGGDSNGRQAGQSQLLSHLVLLIESVDRGTAALRRLALIALKNILVPIGRGSLV